MDDDVENIEHIPEYLNAEAFITARFKEISALTNLIGESKKVTSIFQRLPKNMRRRAMSHSIKRVPRNLRSAHKSQLEKNKALKKRKKPRRYFRKRAKELLFEYNRRQKTNLWLETHIWHAKRFHMSRKWGYKLAEKSCDKTFKSSYRATTSHCLLQDISYFSCIEFSGPIETLLSGFKLITHSECGLSMKAKCWLNGGREGMITLYHINSYPFRVIGNVTFMWKPNSQNNIRTLWLWSHPAFYEEVVEEIIKVFDLKFTETLLKTENKDFDNLDKFNDGKNLKKNKRRVELIKISRKNIPLDKIPKYENRQHSVIVFLLKDNLNRFRLTGPLSNAVLTNALHAAEMFDKFLLKSNVKISKKKNNWWAEYRSHHKNSNFVALQLLDEYSTPSQFPSNVIFGGYIVDPRLFLKRKRKKALSKNRDNNYLTSIPINASENKIWEADIRDNSIINKITLAELNKLRSNLLVPGHDEQLLKTADTVIPILFVQRPGSFSKNVKSGYGSGWDIIIPAGWGMPVWLSLILCGAKPGALREHKTIHFESKKMPDLFPDSQAGDTYYNEIKTESENKYFRFPPKKRTNYIKNGFPTPFYYPWNTLTKEWCETISENSFFVLRNRNELHALKEYVENIKTKQSFSPPSFRTFDSKCLIPINLTMLKKGCLVSFSHICIPTESDLIIHTNNKTFLGPEERMHTDMNKMKRRQLRKEHTKELKSLRRKRIKEEKAKIEKYLPVKLTKRKHSPTEDIVKDYNKTVRALWIPSTDQTGIRKHCGREICGFVIYSGFSFMESGIIGQAYITLQSLYVLMKLWQQFKCEPVVFTRSPNTLIYRFTYVDIVV